MHSIPVIAVARARLHADVMMIRLRRAAISIDNVSALFPSASLPNSVACWLRHWRLLTLRTGSESLMAVGPIGRWLRGTEKNDVSPAQAFRHARFDPMTAQQLEEHLQQGRILLCVHAATEEEVAVSWHVFKHAGAEVIALPTLPLNTAGSGAQTRTSHQAAAAMSA